MTRDPEQAAATSEEHLGELTVDARSWPLVMNSATERFEARVGEHVAFIKFHLRDSTLSLIHAESPTALRGKGVADTLARNALDYARSHKMTVMPYCPFVARYIERHPAYKDLIDPGFRTNP